MWSAFYSEETPMRTKHFLIAGLLALGLAGCGHAPQSHSLAYYNQHRKATEKTLTYCYKHENQMGARNCQNALNAEMNFKMTGGPHPKLPTYGNPSFGYLGK